jgi:N-methylhydantoinase B
MNIFGGGWGGRPHEDGESAAVSICQGDVRNTPVELQEIHYPFLLECHRLRADSGGPGRYRGGLGIEIRYRALQECTVNINLERTVDPPWGVNGGQNGAVNRCLVRRANGEEREIKKESNVPLAPGDTVTFLTAGGGGYGDPRERERSLIERDLELGYVTPEAAARDYGYSQWQTSKRSAGAG